MNDRRDVVRPPTKASSSAGAKTSNSEKPSAFQTREKNGQRVEFS